LFRPAGAALLALAPLLAWAAGNFGDFDRPWSESASVSTSGTLQWFMDDDATIDERVTSFANAATVYLRLVTDDTWNVSSANSTVVTAKSDTTASDTINPTWTEVSAGAWETSFALATTKNDSHAYIEIDIKDAGNVRKFKAGSYLKIGTPASSANTRAWYRDSARTLPSDPELFARGATYPVVFTGPGGGGGSSWDATKPVNVTIDWSYYDATRQTLPNNQAMTQVGGEVFYYNVVVPSSGNGTREWVTIWELAKAQVGDKREVRVWDNAFMCDKVWIGDTSGSWNTAANWLPSGVPTASHVVVIPSSAYYGNAPALDVSTTVAALVIKSGATLAGGAGTNTLTVSGDLTVAGTLDLSAADESISVGGTALVNGTLKLGSGTVTVTGATDDNGTLEIGTGTFDANGSFDATGGAVTFAGAGRLQLGSAVTSLGTFTPGSGTVEYDDTAAARTVLAVTYNKLEIDGGGQTHAAGGAMTATGELRITSGGFTAPSGTLTVGGNFVNNGTFTHNSGTVLFNGTTTVSGSSATTFNHVTITGALTGHATSMRVAGNWTQSGTYTHNSGEVVFTGAATAVLSGSTTFRNFTCSTSGKQLTFTAGTTQTVQGTFKIEGSSSNPVKLRSSVAASKWSIDFPNGAQTVTGADVQDSDALTNNVTVYNGVNSGNNNTRWLFPDPLFWVGGTGNWSDGGRWALTSGGVGGFGPPSSTAVAVFDANSGSGTATVDIAVDVAGLSLRTGNAMTISQGANTITFGGGGFEMAAGTFTGGSAAVTLGGKLTLSGGSLTATSGTFSLSGDFDHAGGTFTHNSGTVRFTGVGTVTGAAAATFYHLTIAGTGSLSGHATSMSVAGNWTNDGTFTHNAGTVVFSGTSAVGGTSTTTFKHVTISGTLTGASGTMNVAGTWTNNNAFTHNSGTVGFTGDTTVGGSATTTFNHVTISGTLTAPAGTMNVAGNWTNNGTFAHNSGTVAFTGTTTVAGSATTTFNHVTISGTLTGAAGTMNVAGNWTNNNAFTHNSGTVAFTGTTTVAGSATTTFKHVTISGTLTGAAGTMNVAGNWTNNNAFTHNSGTVAFTGTTAIGGTAVTTFNHVSIGGGAGLTGPSGTVKVAGNWSNSGTYTHNSGKVEFVGAVTATLSGNTTFYNFLCQAAGKQLNFTAGSNQTVAATFSIRGGSSNNILLRSSADGNKWSVTLNGGAQTAYYADVKDSDALTNTVTVFNGINSGNNNANWLFDLLGDFGDFDRTWSQSASVSASGTLQWFMDDDATIDENVTTFANGGTIYLRVETNGSFTVSSDDSLLTLATRTSSASSTSNPTWTEVQTGIWETSVAIPTTLNDSNATIEIDLRDTGNMTKLKVGSFLTIGAGGGSVGSRTWYRNTARTLAADPTLFARGTSPALEVTGPSSWTSDKPVKLTIAWSDYDNTSQASPNAALMTQVSTSATFYYVVAVPSSGDGSSEWVSLRIRAQAQFGAMASVVGWDNAYMVHKVWIGDTDSNWTTAGNWLPSGVPAATDVVAIPSSAYYGNAPRLNANATVLRLILKPGGTLLGSSAGTFTLTVTDRAYIFGTLDFSADDESIVVGGNCRVKGTVNLGTGTVDANAAFTAANGYVTFTGAGLLRLGGSILNLGTLTAGPGTVEFDGAGVNQTIPAAGLTYNHLTIDNTGTAVATQETGSTLDVNGNFRLDTSDAEFTATTTVTVARDFINNGVFNNGGQVVAMDGSVDQSVGGTVATTFSTLRVANTGAVSSVEVSIANVGATPDATATNVEVNDGKLQIGSGAQLNVSGTVKVQTASDSTLELTGSGILQITNASALESRVESTGTLQLTGVSAARPSLYIDNSNTTITVAGTLKTSFVDVKPQITKTAAGAGLYRFRVVGGTLDVSGLEFSYAGSNGFEVGDGTTGATYTRFDKIRFTSAVSGGSHLKVRAAGPLTIDAPGAYFDASFGAGSNVYVEDTNSTADVVVVLEDRSLSENGPGRGEAYDADVTGGLAVWVSATTDLGGAINGTPTTAYNIYSALVPRVGTYVVARDVFGTTDDRIYIVGTDGSLDSTYATPYVTVPASSGNIVGPVWWDTDANNTTLTFYFGTDTGYVYRVVNDTVAKTLTIPAGWPFSDATWLSQVTSPVTSDRTNVYFGGLDAGGLPKVFAVAINPGSPPTAAWRTGSLGSGAIVRGQVAIADASTSSFLPSAHGIVIYVATEHSGSSAQIRQVSIAGVEGQSVTTSKLHDIRAGPRISTERLVATDLGGKLHRLNLVNFADDGGWPYKSTVHADPDGSPGSDVLAFAARGEPYRDIFGGYSPSTANTNGFRVYYGDDDGHLYVVASAWPPKGTQGEPLDVDPDGSGGVPAFPLLLESGVRLAGMPQYWSGVIHIANENGKVFVVDESQGGGSTSTDFNRAVIKTYNFGAGVKLGAIEWDDGAQRYTVAGTNAAGTGGRIYYFPDTADPTP
jgi:hypothetical protein